MLKLKKVELQGFKSFCDRTELRFSGGGIAAVVGPNGCGKSNLSDAISWVLGEQSARTLRGSRMEDVIFAGTKSRKAVGMASVTMVLADPRPEPAQPPAAHGQSDPAENVTQIQPQTRPGEVTITRRLFRSGESEYLIDGRQARLRDIQDIFMGSGLGPESYAIIEQGRIGQILSSKPQDRRAIIEEAAGITKYKSRRRLAEAKLESSKQNLARVFDILEEVTRQVNSLKRQAAKAKRYNELKAELEGELRTVLAGRFVTLKAEAEKAAAALDLAAAELRDVTVQAADRDAERQKAQEVFYALEADLTEGRRQLSEMNVEAERARGRLESQVREAASIEQRMSRADRETADLEDSLKSSETERAGLAETSARLEREMQDARAGLMEKNRVRDEIQVRVREAEKAIESSRTVILRLLGEASAVRNQIAQADTYLAGIERERVRVRNEEQTASAEIDRLAGVKRQLSETAAQRQLHLQSVAADRLQTEESLAGKRRSSAELRQQIDQLRAESSRLKAKRESLDNILQHHTYANESTRKLLAAIRSEGVLADFIEVEPAWEKASEEFLHDELEYVVVRDWDEAEQSMNLLRTDLEGRATFLVHSALVHSAAPCAPAGDAAVPGTPGAPLNLPSLSDKLSFTNGFRGQSLLTKLDNTYLVEDRAQARSLAEQHPDKHFLLADGQSYTGRLLTGGRKKSSGPLVLKRELREYAGQQKINDQSLAEKVREAEGVQSETQALESDLERLRQNQQTAEKETVSLDHDLRRASEEINRANSRVSVARLELERLNREEERAIAKRTENQASVEQKDAERAEREQNLETLRDQLETAQTDAQRIGEEHSGLRAQLAALEERHRGARSAFARVENQAREMTERRLQIASEVERWGETRARILNDNIELDKKITDLAERISAAERAVLEMTASEARQRESLAEADEILRELRARIEAGHARRSEIEVDLTRRQAELQFLDETSRKELNAAVADLEPPADASPEVLQAAERQYHETKARIENLGAVNPGAFEEHEEARLRQEFLTVQRQDLLDSIRDTEKAIQEIDEFSKNRFTEAFNAINENFKVCFQTLFGGGAGEMRLTDSENVNDSGIDMIASPPGKKLQNVLLLSGGEKALTALSLLMAIFKYQPSPFCVLDEVDAPLDEANIGRLMRLLSEMSLDTQFIIITHSKKTMESAQAMYGVTMQEAGISKLVSVKFHHQEAAA